MVYMKNNKINQDKRTKKAINKIHRAKHAIPYKNLQDKKNAHEKRIPQEKIYKIYKISARRARRIRTRASCNS